MNDDTVELFDAEGNKWIYSRSMSSMIGPITQDGPRRSEAEGEALRLLLEFPGLDDESLLATWLLRRRAFVANAVLSRSNSEAK